jgi:hypothetical protein
MHKTKEDKKVPQSYYTKIKIIDILEYKLPSFLCVYILMLSYYRCSFDKYYKVRL